MYGAIKELRKEKSMALGKELEVLVSDSLGGEQWFTVVSINYDDETVTFEDYQFEHMTVDLDAENVHDIRIVE